MISVTPVHSCRIQLNKMEWILDDDFRPKASLVTNFQSFFHSLVQSNSAKPGPPEISPYSLVLCRELWLKTKDKLPKKLDYVPFANSYHNTQSLVCQQVLQTITDATLDDTAKFHLYVHFYSALEEVQYPIPEELHDILSRLIISNFTKE